MFSKLLKSADLRQLSSFVSPAFFDVLPARKIWSRGRALMISKSSPEYRDAVSARARSLQAVPLAVELPGQPVSRDTLGDDQKAHATRLVTLYFEQIYSDTPTLLDLRGQSARSRPGQLAWDPAPWVARWSPDFHTALRNLYEGFYAPDDALLTESLKALRIDIAEDLFRQHFGAHPEAQRFVMKDFVNTFHQVFVRCKEQKRELHEDFLALGVYLATLYDHLDGIPVEIDVAGCYARARRRAKEARTNGAATVDGQARHG
ncbi:MAG TPA: hypothetical protein VFX59_15645 [Polyangiales bacterium]|nr:hypothetical protein [Polyangiales bacterium]